ncbi:MAG TPA: cytochrome c oxidase subunit 4, partial [Actinomycetota bacterium]
LGTMWGGRIRMTTPLLFAVGLVGMFTIGGLSGVTHAIVPHDYQQTDTYYIVAHFHYVLFGGAVFGLFAGAYYWWPKVFGRQLSEAVGKLHFWLMLIGFNLTFGPFHILGLQGMIRRTYTYPEALGLTFWNQVSTVGAALIAVSILLFIVNVIRTQLTPRPDPLAMADPWDGRTIEWMTTSPPPVHNFDEIPTIHALDDFWHRKYVEDERTGRLVPAQAGAAIAHETTPGAEHGHGHAIHMPSPSFWPFVAALGLPVIGYGVVFDQWWLGGLGAVLALVGFYGWAMEPSVAGE